MGPQNKGTHPNHKTQQNTISGFNYPKVIPLRALTNHIVGWHIATSEYYTHILNTPLISNKEPHEIILLNIMFPPLMVTHIH
jgi:hypothetical protein